MLSVLCRRRLADLNVVVVFRLRAVVSDCDRGRTRGLLPHAGVVPRPSATERSRPSRPVFAITHQPYSSTQHLLRDYNELVAAILNAQIPFDSSISCRYSSSTKHDELDWDAAIARLNSRKNRWILPANQLSDLKSWVRKEGAHIDTDRVIGL